MYRKITSLILVFAFIFSLIGCSAKPQESQSTQPSETVISTEPSDAEPNAQELYNQARTAIDDAQNLLLDITTRTKYTVAQSEFEYYSVQTLQLANIGTDALSAQLTETITAVDFEDSFDEYYADGTLYSKVFDSYLFKGSIEQEHYLSRFAPAVLLDASLYSEITTESISGGMLLKFSDPSGPEVWALPEDAVFNSADGSAFIEADGTLTRTTYTITYTYGASVVTETITVTPQVENALLITAPDNAADYTELDWITAPRAYDMALIALCCSKSATSTITETIVSEAAACVHTTLTTVDFCGSGENFVSKIKYDVTLAQDGSADAYSQEELYRDGAYSITENGSEPQSADITPEDMLAYCQGYLWENIFSLLYLENAAVSEVGGLLYLELDFTEEYGNELNKYANSILFSDENFLDNYASAYSTTECFGYIAIDPVTGFPTATGISYSGVHTIDGADYALTLQTDQSFDLASLSAFKTVTGEAPAETEPETKATPLFYHVTGENGQEMWLLGTIHVGDGRTAYLPQEIYDALDASDALAVEFDTLAFEESMETDAQLMTQIAQCYFYSDASLTKDHLGEDVYEDAVKLLKASGSYNANAEYMVPSIWSQSIDNFYLKIGYDLLPEKGVDYRLLGLAKDKGMQIRDIESGLFQMQMFAGFSDELQALLLEESISYTATEFNSETAELYELWCAGDEPELRKMLSTAVDTSEFTTEELAEYEENKHLLDEYNKAMSYDRNEGMLQTAIDYLESSDTVFFAVGLAHLLDDVNGLVDALRDAGYSVERVTYQ